MTQLSLPFDLPPPDADDEALTIFAARQLATMKEEATSASTLTTSAFQRAWGIGKVCVALKERIGDEKWQDWATQHIGAAAGTDYWPIYRSMRLARMSPDAPPLKGSAQYKQLQIALGEEPAPKTTPRKTDSKKFVNFVAMCVGIVRWFRGGDVFKGMDRDTAIDVAERLKPIRDIIDAADEYVKSLE